MNSQQGNQQAAQNDQQIMENILLTTKGACDLYMHCLLYTSRCV